MGKTQYPHSRERKFGPLPYTVLKNNSKWIKGLNVRAKTIKLLKENLRVKLHDIGFGNHCLDMTPKAQATKEKKNVFLLFDVRRHQNSKLVCIKGHCQQNEKATHSIG